MIDAPSLRQALKTIYGVEDKYLVPLDEGWYVPTFDPTDKVGSWIGYRILSKRPALRAYKNAGAYVRSLKVIFRISFVGPQAETLADQTMLWDDRKDVREAFDAMNAQLDYDKRTQFSFPVKNGGLNDNLCWCVDFAAHTFFEKEVKYEKWNLKGVTLGGNIIIPTNKEDNNG